MEVPPGLPPDLWDRLAAYLRDLDRSLGARPRAVLVISGHWEMEHPTVNMGTQPPLLFDYYGFPPHTYQLKYAAPGSPAVAARVRELLTAAGMPSLEEGRRGLDHGVFVPFKLIYPDADVPMVQMSLHRNLDAATHLEIGRALSPLREEGVLIVGSGMSYHNLRDFYSADPRAVSAAEQFDTWLNEAVTHPDGVERDSRLCGWASAAGARSCHPRPEHLIPLMVAAGAAGSDSGRRTFHDRLLGKPIAGFQFG